MSDARKIAGTIRSNRQMEAAFQIEFISRLGERMYPCHFLAFKRAGLVEPYDGRSPRLTPLGQQVRAILMEGSKR